MTEDLADRGFFKSHGHVRADAITLRTTKQEVIFITFNFDR
jgi:hypothetical protein